MSRVNIITAFYNTNLNLFKRCAESVLEQKYPSITWIVIDDGSTLTKPNEIVDVAARQSNVKFERLEKNVGPGAARNAGFKLLDENCEFICFLDSDDFLTPTSIEDRIIALDRHWVSHNRQPVMVYGAKYTKDIRNHKTETIMEAAAPFDFSRLLQECYISSNSVLFRKDMFEKYIGQMSTNVMMCEDYLLWRQLSCLGEVIKIDNPVYTQVIHGTNLTCTPEILANHGKDLWATNVVLNKWYIANKELINQEIKK